MHRWMAPLIVFALAIGAARAADKPEKKEGFKALQQEFVQKARAATPDKRKEIAREYGSRFLKFAQENPKDPSALDALMACARLNQGESGPDSAVEQAAALLAKDHVKDPRIAKAVAVLASEPGEGGITLARAVMAKNPDRKVQARACQGVQQGREQLAKLAKRIEENKQLREQAEKILGKESTEKLLTSVPRYEREAKEFGELVKTKYDGVFPNLSVGKKAPEVVSQDVKGKAVKLSDLRGKVVVLDIWATWCPPCRAMIPHERELVKRLEGKPFVLVSISSDAKKKDLTDFLAKESMPWPQWWNGAEGGIVEDWDVRYFPTIYVLDAQGVIRYKDVRGKAMDEAVDTLLKEMEGKGDKPASK